MAIRGRDSEPTIPRHLFSPAVRNLFLRAETQARQLGHPYIGTHHLILGILDGPESDAKYALRNLGLTIENAKAAIQPIIDFRRTVPDSLPLTPKVQQAILAADELTTQRGKNQIGTNELLSGIAKQENGLGNEMIKKASADTVQKPLESLEEDSD